MRCGESLQDQMVGMWVSDFKGICVALNDDGTYGKGHSPEQAEAGESQTPGFEWGTWTVEEGVLTFTTPEEAPYCGGTVGTYEVAVSDTGDELSPTLVEDGCTTRAADFPLGLTRHTESET
jgi:hypothetical protein